jgi:hypothetical protein
MLKLPPNAVVTVPNPMKGEVVDGLGVTYRMGDEEHSAPNETSHTVSDASTPLTGSVTLMLPAVP